MDWVKGWWYFKFGKRLLLIWILHHQLRNIFNKFETFFSGRFKVGQNLAVFSAIKENFTRTEFLRAIRNWYESEVFRASVHSVEHFR